MNALLKKILLICLSVSLVTYAIAAYFDQQASHANTQQQQHVLQSAVPLMLQLHTPQLGQGIEKSDAEKSLAKAQDHEKMLRWQQRIELQRDQVQQSP